MGDDAMSYVWPEYFQPKVVQGGYGGGVLSSYCLALEAWRRGLEVSIGIPGATRVRVSDGRKVVRFDHSRPDVTTKEATSIIDSKYKTSEALRAHSVPVPESYLFDTDNDDYELVAEKAVGIGFPVVLKPVKGSTGRGVFANIANEEQLKACFEQIVNVMGKKKIVLERHHAGDDLRVYVVGDKYVAAAHRIPANVVGDGSSTIDQLISEKNKHRRKNPFLSGGLIVKDYEVTEMISRAGYSLSSVLEPGCHLPLREKANASAGGDVVDLTDMLPERIRESAVAAVKHIPGLESAGVDVLWDQQSEPGSDGEYVILEMNSRAHIGVNMYPTSGVGQDVPKAIIDHLFPDSPRRKGEEFATLKFSRRDAIGALTSGPYSSVTLAPAPEHGYPVRRHYSASDTTSLSNRDRISLLILARKSSIACTVNLSGNRPGVTIGAKDFPALSLFRDEVSRRLGEDLKKSNRKVRVLYAGFRVT